MNDYFRKALTELAKHTDSFPTKAAQKRVLEHLNSAYSEIRSSESVFEAPFDLHGVRGKHSELFGERWGEVAELGSIREQVKSMPIIKHAPKTLTQKISEASNISEEVISQIMTSLEPSLKHIEEQTFVSDLNYFQKIKDAIKKLRQQTLTHYEYDRQALNIAGSQTTLSLVRYYHGKEFTDRVKKISEQTNEKRKFLIAKKLANYEIDKVTLSDIEVNSHSTGVTGTYNISSNERDLTLEIQLIYAGGENVQRLHTRCITKLFEPAPKPK